MKELDKKAFDQSYKYDDYKKQIKKSASNGKRHDNKSAIGIKILLKVYKRACINYQFCYY